MKQTLQNKQIISLELSTELKKMLQKDAELKEMSTSALIRYIIKKYYKDQKGLN